MDYQYYSVLHIERPIHFGDSHKYNLLNWGLISGWKDFGGMSVPNLRDFNLALLASWAGRYFLGCNKKAISTCGYTYNTHNPIIYWLRLMLSS